MGLPRELRDELLSGYLDGVLSNDERARVEQMLASDPGLRGELDALRQQSALLGQLRAANGRRVALGDGFADRVISAALEVAEREGVHAGHPLLRLQGVPTAVRTTTGRSPAARRRLVWSGGLLAAAASVFFAAIFLRSGGDMPQQFAAQGTTIPLVTTQREHPSKNDEAVQAGANLPMVANSDGEQALPKPALGELIPEQLSTNDIPVNPPAEMSADLPTLPLQTSADTGLVAEDGGLALPAEMKSLRAVLVYEVTLTPLGRQNMVVERALRESGIRVGNQRQVDDALTSHLQQGGLIGGVLPERPASQADRVDVLFLDGSGRRLELAMMKLLEAQGEVKQVGFNLVMDPPVMVAMDALQGSRPEEIRSFETDAIAEVLRPAASSSFSPSERQFLPLDRATMGMMGEMHGLTGAAAADVPAQVLMIIRFSE